MATDARAELRVDVHSIEPIPEADRDSTGPPQMRIAFVTGLVARWSVEDGLVPALQEPIPQPTGAAQC